MTRLEDMTTAEIAEAVDASKYWRNSYYCINCTARTYAFSWFSAQYLMVMNADPLWLFLITLAVIVVERGTNRLTLKTYSTSQAIDHWLHKIPIEVTPSRWTRRHTVILAISLTVVLGCEWSEQFYPCQIVLAAAMVSLITYAKTKDFAKATVGVPYVVVCHSPATRPDNDIFYPLVMHLSFLAAPVLALTLYVTGEMKSLLGHEVVSVVHGMPAAVLVACVFSVTGCCLHEMLRFYLVQREIDRVRKNIGCESQD